MKLAFHAVVTNYCGNMAVSSIIFYVVVCLVIKSMSSYKYLQTTILDCSKALTLVLIPPKNYNNVIPSLGGVQVIN